MKIIVLGGGVAGLTAAWFLRQDGHQVTIVEKNPGVALETSYANGGQLSYSYVAPLASPGVLPKLPPWLLRRDSPLRFRPAWDLHQWRWCLTFLFACNAAQSELTTKRLLKLAFYSRDLLRELVATVPIEFDYSRAGKLVVHSAQGGFDAARRLLDYQASLGCEQSALDADACIRLEPALENMRARLVGGIYTASEDAGDCYDFCKGLEALMRTGPNPVQFQLDTTIHRLLHWKREIIGVETNRGVLEGDRYILALGSNAPFLVKPLGLYLPVYPLKGYSLTLPIKNDAGAPTISVTDFKRKVVYARLGNELRVAGMADLAGYSSAIDEERVATLIEQAKEAFPDASDFTTLKPWCGLRPATPKAPPILGVTPYPRLLLNVGHGALGFTLSMGCAKTVADLIAGRAVQIPLDGMTLGT